MKRLEEIQEILNMPAPRQNEEINETLPEDLGIVRNDGYRSCINWELRGKGFHVESEQTYETLSDKELLTSAYLEIYSGF
ncbi:hypothetical protein KAS08_04905 [Candidatus Pacearchaeota archaeon]|nr:hypothetical protein [Candidatus Pacearchaeota archaeon]